MKVPCGDGLYETYQKTILAIKMLDALEIKYDWILKTNTSTWINAQILDRFVKEIPVYEKTKIFTGKIYSSEDSCGPDEYDYYGLGKYILISDFWADVLKQNPAEEYRKYNRNTKVNPEHEVIYNVDDNAIGFVVNTFCELNYVDKHSVWKYFDTPTGEMINYYMKYIAVSVRNYNEDQRDRELIYLEEYYEGLAKDFELSDTNLVDIAKKLGCTPQTVSNTRNSPIVKRRIRELQNMRDQGAVNFAAEVQARAGRAFEIVDEALNDEVGEVPLAMRLKEANNILDRVERVEGIGSRNVHLHAHLTAEDIERLKERALAAGLASGQVVDMETENATEE